jgi:alpha-tubulin suppressor-like RCC1 family protein
MKAMHSRYKTLFVFFLPLCILFITFQAKASLVGSWSNISSQSNHSVAIKPDGTLWAWGDNHLGQLGDGTNANKFTPIQIGSETNWQSVQVGSAHSIAIKTDGTLWAWGYNYYGQLGDGSNVNKSTPTQIGTDTNWQSVQGGAGHTLAIKTDGTLWAWGGNEYGLLGDGSNVNKSTPTQIGNDSNWQSVQAGYAHSIAIKADGTLWGWGSNYYGQLDDAINANSYSPIQIGNETNWQTVQAGYFHNIAIKTDGTLWAWGQNSNGQIGDGTTVNKSVPTQIGNESNWQSAQAGWEHTLAIRTDGTLWAWGSNEYGQLGDGNTVDKLSPIQVGNESNWQSVQTGSANSFAIKTDDTLWAWGNKEQGRLGFINRGGTFIPTQYMPFISWQWKSVVAGTDHTIAIKADDTLWAWGSNLYGGLGDGTNVRKSTPIQIGNESNWQSVQGGDYHSLAIKSDGSLWAWGANHKGQLGDGTTVNKSTPIQIGTDTNWQSVQAGGDHSLAIKSDGTLWAWGKNDYGQLGDGTETNKSTPIQIGSDSNWQSVQAGEYYSLALKSDGTLWMWGRNEPKLTAAYKTTPTQIGSDTNWQSIQAGDYDSLAIKSDGTLWAWGQGYAYKQIPIQIGYESNWQTIEAGSAHSLAIKSDGTLWAWGRNVNGELGIGTFTNRSGLVQIGSESNWQSVQAGGRHSSAIKTNGSLWTWGHNHVGQLGDGSFSGKASPQLHEFIDSDGDGIADINDAFPLDATEQVDTDGDGIGDNADAFPLDATEQVDTEGDGLGDNADAFPLDATEQIDTDGDGVGNNTDNDDDNDGILDEDDDEPLTAYIDTQTPVFGNIEQVIIEATGKLTEVSLITPTVTDNYDTALVVESDVEGSLAIGTHQVLWTATDSAGNQSTATQVVVLGDTTEPVFTSTEVIAINAQGRLTDVRDFIDVLAFDLVDGETPLTILDETKIPSGEHTLTIVTADKAGNEASEQIAVTIYPEAMISASLLVEAGGNYNHQVILSGDAPSYPVQVDYQLIQNGSVIDTSNISIAAGIQGNISFTLPNDALVNDELLLSLTATANAFIGDSSHTQLVVIENNGAPLLNVELTQSGENVSVVDPGNGLVKLTAIVNDVNQLDEHDISWLVNGNAFTDEGNDSNELTFEVEPSALTEGVYTVDITITENNTDDVLSVSQRVQFVVEQLSRLDVSNDSDGDGISDSEEGYSDSDGDGIADYLDNDSNTSRLPSNDNAEPMQTSVGLVMSLGAQVSVADGSSSKGASLTIDELANAVPEGSADTNDDHYAATSTVYNFVISGLAQQGDSVTVVIPLESGASLFADSLYRKYNTVDGWYTFVENESNSVSSAMADENGNCPAANSASYTIGLNEGNNCVQLIIEDGGANDADFTINGSVEDPGVFVIEKANNAPNIDLATDTQTNEETSISLDASQTTDADGDELTYSWQQLSGVEVELTETTNATLTFISPSVTTDEQLTFELTVDDGRDSSTSIATVTVLQINKAPTVTIDSHDNSYEEGTTLTIISQGSDSDDNDTLSYQWEQLSGATITFDDATAAQVSIVLPEVSADEVIEVQVTVSDSELSATTTTSFTVSNKVEVITVTPEKKSSGGTMAWLLLFVAAVCLSKLALMR